ncbi:MAG TPA: VOC family protein [Terriglobales bacterium]|nr:VOC family protein [Terriglobales bacterium]
MAITDKPKTGSFCWIELSTTDQNAAKSFYTSLFGWAVNDMPMGPDGVYTIFQLQGGDVGAACTLRPEQRSQGIPPHWMPYILVESADAAATRAAQVGGKVCAPAFDVMDVGRMAVIQDPTGATFCVWQAKQSSGVTVRGVDGTLCWADLSTPDQARAGKFYSDLFGWKLSGGEHSDPPSDYLHIQNGGDFIGGIPPAAHRDPGTPAHWLAYFQTSNCDATAAKAKQLGAKFYLEPMTMENVGRFGVLADPQGAVFAIFQSMPRK